MPLIQPEIVDSSIKSALTSDEDSGVRLNVRLSPEAKRTLDEISAYQGSSYVEVIRRSIGTEKFFQDVKKKGGRILLEIPGEKHLKEVVFAA